MKNKKKQIVAIAAGILSASIMSANATLIDFNDLGGYPIPEATYSMYLQMRLITLDGFTITPHGVNPYLIDPSLMYTVRSSLYGNTDNLDKPWNGTDYLHFDPGLEISVAPVSGYYLPSFSLNSFDLAIYGFNPGATYDDAIVVGIRTDDSIVSQTITLDTTPNELKTTGNDFTHYNFTGFDNLKSVNISYIPRDMIFITRFYGQGAMHTPLLQSITSI